MSRYQMLARPRLFQRRGDSSLLAVLVLAAATPGIAHSQTASATRSAGLEVASDTEQEAWLAVTLNGHATDQIVLALRQKDHLLLRAEDLKSFRLLLPQTAGVTHAGTVYYSLEELAGLTYRIDEAQQALFLQAPAKLFETSTVPGRGSVSTARPTLPPNGGFLNYDVLSSRLEGVTRTNALLEGNVFGPMGSGMIRFLEQDTENGVHGVRLETTWTRDFPDSATTLRLGDAITGASRWWGGAVHFGGVQWGTNFATRPDLVTIPMPTLAGESVLPSTLDLYVNGALRMRRDLPAGPFTMQNIPVVTGDGDVRLVVTDALGRQQVITQSYYASPQMLRAGLSDYSYEAGFIRDQFGSSSNDYGRALVVGTHRAGLTGNFTGEIHAELLRDQQTAGIAGAALVPWAAVVSLGIAGSRSTRGAGELITLGVERTTRRLSVGANAQFASRDFVNIGLAPTQLAPTRTIQTFIGYTLGLAGSLTLTHTRQDFRDRASVELVSAHDGLRVGEYGFLTLSVLRVLGDRPDTIAGLTFTHNFGARAFGNLSVTSDSSGTQMLMQLQKSLPPGPGVGYQLAAGAGVNNERQASVSLQNDVGTYLVEADSTRGQTGVRASASGSVALLGGATFASRRIDDSFAVAQVAQREGVHVYSDNQLIGRTNSRGYVLVPRLRAYQDNVIAVDPADLPLDFNVDAAQIQAVPYSHSGLLLNFPIDRPAAALISIVLEDGAPLPPGATVSLLGGTAGETPRFPVGLNGEAYVTGLAASNRLRVSWPGHNCELTVSYSRTEDPWQHLGPFTCKEEPE